MNFQQPLRIGARASKLSIWQATQLLLALEKININSELITIQSAGDLDLINPIYAMSEIGVFSKALDLALINQQIDIAVHSLKDLPTQLPAGILQAAVLPRGDVQDVLVLKNKFEFNDHPATIATGSLRRKAQWLARYPNHQIVNLRGNVISRLEKLNNSNWQGAIFAKAGLARVGKLHDLMIDLDWMIPAPGQGSIAMLTREQDVEVNQLLSTFNSAETLLCIKQERDFLRYLEGGCSAPIGAYAYIKEQQLYFKGGLFALDGSKQIIIEQAFPLENADGVGKQLAEEVLAKGGEELMQEIKQAMTNDC